MDAELERIARWLQAQPWNLPGADKTWVLKGAWAALQFQRAVMRAERVADR